MQQSPAQSEHVAPAIKEKPSTKHSSGGVSLLNANGTLDLSDVPEDIPPIPRTSTRSTSTWSSKYKGVCRNGSKKWKAHINHHGVLLYLGTFDTQEEAAVVFARAHYKLHGPSDAKEPKKKPSSSSRRESNRTREKESSAAAKDEPPSPYTGLDQMSAAARFVESYDMPKPMGMPPQLAPGYPFVDPRYFPLPQSMPFTFMPPMPAAQPQMQQMKPQKHRESDRVMEMGAQERESRDHNEPEESEDMYLAETIRSLAKEIRARRAKEQQGGKKPEDERAEQGSMMPSPRMAEPSSAKLVRSPNSGMKRSSDSTPSMVPPSSSKRHMASGGYGQMPHMPAGVFMVPQHFPTSAMGGDPQQMMMQMMGQQQQQQPQGSHNMSGAMLAPGPHGGFILMRPSPNGGMVPVPQQFQMGMSGGPMMMGQAGMYPTMFSPFAMPSGMSQGSTPSSSKRHRSNQ